MLIEFQLEPEDWEAFGAYSVTGIAAIRAEIDRHRRQLLIGGVALAVVVTAYIGVGVELVVLALASALLFALFPLVMRAAMRRSMRRMFLTSSNPCLRGLHRLEARADGLANSCDSGSGVTNWAAVTSIEETDEHAMLVYSGNVGVAIPRARVRQGDLAAFVSAVRENLRVGA